MSTDKQQNSHEQNLCPPATQHSSPPSDAPTPEHTLYYHKPLHQYIEDLASKKPAPGGGSVTALTGLQATSLILMVTQISLKKAQNKPGPDNDQKATTLKRIIEASKSIHNTFAQYIDEDIQVFQKILQTHKAFSQNPNKHTHDALKTSINTSISLCDSMLTLSKEVVSLAHESIDISYEALLSDIEIAKVLAESTQRSAQINKDINIKSLRELPSIESLEELASNIKNAKTTKVLTEKIQRRVQTNKDTDIKSRLEAPDVSHETYPNKQAHTTERKN